MKNDLAFKIEELIKSGRDLDEHKTRSLMILIRKNLELMSDSEKNNFLVLNLFCNIKPPAF